MRRIRILIAYDGTEFHGWQIQPGLPTIQGVLEEIIGGIEKKAVHVAGSGRTDAGVHALGQVAAFTIANPIPVDNLRRAVNRLLPPAIRILEVSEAPLDFHPRFDAIGKTYRYTIFRAEVCPPFEWRFVHHHPYPLNETAMFAASRVFEGEHDFTAFAASDERDAEGKSPEGKSPAGKSKTRRIFRSVLERSGHRLVLTVSGNGFLKHMVRNMVGTLIEAGKGNIDETGIRRLLIAPPNEKAGPTAPAKGLTLESVEYKPHFDHMLL